MTSCFLLFLISWALFSLITLGFSIFEVRKASRLDSLFTWTLISLANFISFSTGFQLVLSASSPLHGYMGLSTLTCRNFFPNNSSIIWLLFAITSAALGVPLCFPVGVLLFMGNILETSWYDCEFGNLVKKEVALEDSITQVFLLPEANIDVSLELYGVLGYVRVPFEFPSGAKIPVIMAFCLLFKIKHLYILTMAHYWFLIWFTFETSYSSIGKYS